jgi:RNA polymerase sigma-70 factor (ECF subfamily)
MTNVAAPAPLLVVRPTAHDDNFDIALRRMFAGVASEPLPAAFVDLLARLEAITADTTAAANPRLSDAAFKQQLAAMIPQLQAYGRRIARDRDLADDLVQETMLKAWSARARFEGNNIRAWCYVILRNVYLSQMRRARFKGEWNEADADRLLATAPAQENGIVLADVGRGIEALPAAQREALLLVSSAGLSYEEVARRCNCAVGTIKSRVARARLALEAAMDEDNVPAPRAAIARAA